MLSPMRNSIKYSYEYIFYLPINISFVLLPFQNPKVSRLDFEMAYIALVTMCETMCCIRYIGQL